MPYPPVRVHMAGRSRKESELIQTYQFVTLFQGEGVMERCRISKGEREILSKKELRLWITNWELQDGFGNKAESRCPYPSTCGPQAGE